MTDNYTRIVKDNLEKLYNPLPEDLADNLPAKREGNRFRFDAFGEPCTIEPGRITLGHDEFNPVLGIILSLYALNAKPDLCRTAPFRAFKDFPGSMPYVGAFATHTEQILVPHVEAIATRIPRIKEKLHGAEPPPEIGGDFSFVVYPLPKIALCYIFYEADEDFPASVTCLYSNNADWFLPLDPLADTGEYTSKKIIEWIGG